MTGNATNQAARNWMLVTAIREFIKRPFIRNVAVLASGTAAAQAISMAFSPLITRLYSPEAYGIQGVFMTVVGMMSIPAALSYPIAIVLPKSDKVALGLVHLSLYIGAAMSLLATGALYFFGREILALMNAEEISEFIYLIPFVMFISVFGTVVSQWLIRKKAFGVTARVAVWTTFLASTTKAGFGFVYPKAAVLIVIYTLSSVLSAVLMLVGWRRSSAKSQPAEATENARGSLWALARQHGDFALLRTPQNLINGISQSLPVMLLATYFGPASVGFYTIATSVLALPAGLIGNSVMQVFYPRINEAMHRGEDVRALIIKATTGMALFGALPFGIVIIAGPLLFSFVFGPEWRTAGVYAQWLSIWLFFQYINKPAVSAIPALRLQGGLLVYELFSTGTKIIALYLGFAVFNSEVAAIALFSIFGVAAYAWLILWVISRAATPSGPHKSML